MPKPTYEYHPIYPISVALAWVLFVASVVYMIAQCSPRMVEVDWPAGEPTAMCLWEGPGRDRLLCRAILVPPPQKEIPPWQ